MKPNHSVLSIKHSPVSHVHSALCILHCALACAVALATAQATAATVTLATADAASAETTSFNSAGGWADGNAPAAGNDYVVALGDSAGLFLPTATATFAGDSLAIGDGTTAGRLNASGANRTLTFGNLVLAKGLLNLSNKAFVTFAGKVTIASTLDDPFVIQGDTGYLNYNGSVFYGEEDAAFLIRSTTTTRSFSLEPNSWSQWQLANYKGRVIIDNAIYRVASFQYGAPTFREDAIVLRNGGALRTNAANPAWNHSKIGVTVEETGGELLNGYAGPKTMSIPFRGGPLKVSTPIRSCTSRLRLSQLTIASGTTVLSAGASLSVTNLVITGGELQYSPGVLHENETPFPVTVRGGRLRLDNMDFTKASVILDGGALCLAGAEGEVSNLVYQSGSVYLKFDTGNATPDCLTLRGTVTGVSAANPLKLSSDIWPAEATAGKSYRVLAVPADVLALTADVSSIAFDVPSQQLAVSVVEESGMRYAVVAQKERDHIRLLAGDADFAATTAFNGNGAQWSNGEVPKAGEVYDVALGTGPGQALHFPNANAAFAGTVLNIGTASAPGRADIGAKDRTYTFQDLMLADGMLVVTNVAAPQTAVNATLAGRVTVKSPAGKPFVLQGNAGTVTIQTGVLRGGEDAVLLVRGTGAARAFGAHAGTQWGNGGYSSYKGKIILDNAFSIHGNLAYGGAAFTPDAITLRNGGALRMTAAGPSWNSNAGITVEASGGWIDSAYGGTVSIYNQIAGGPLRLAARMNLYNRTALTDFISYADVTVCSGATCDNARYEVLGGTLAFNEGVTFAARATAPEILVTNATLKAGAGMLAALRPVVRAGGVLAISNDGPLCQAASTTNAVLGAGATLRLDVDVENGVCDSLFVVGEGASFEATEESPLQIVVVPADAAYEPPAGSTFTFNLLSLPARAGAPSRKNIAMTLAEGLPAGLKLYVLQQDGRQIVRLTNRNPGTCIMLR